MALAIKRFALMPYVLYWQSETLEPLCRNSDTCKQRDRTHENIRRYVYGAIRFKVIVICRLYHFSHLFLISERAFCNFSFLNTRLGMDT